MRPPIIPVASLIEVGRCVLSQIEAPETLFRALEIHDQINRLNRDPWDAVTSALPDDELVALFRGVIVTERRLGWSGGSVAAGVWVYRELSKRGDEIADREAEWAIANSNNPWIPFGADRLCATTLSEYLSRRTRRDRQIQQGLKEKLDAEEEAARDRTRAQRERLRAAELRRTETRKQFISDLSAFSVQRQLEQLANDEDFPLEWYPTRLAHAATGEALGALAPDVRRKLLRKCAGKHRGAWARFKRRLLRAEGETVRPNRKPWFR